MKSARGRIRVIFAATCGGLASGARFQLQGKNNVKNGPFAKATSAALANLLLARSMATLKTAIEIAAMK
jgi:hypothetical protein